MKGVTIKRLAIKLLIFAKKAAPYVLATASAAGTVAVTIEAVKEIQKNTPKVYYAKQDDTIDELDKKSEDGTLICIVKSDTDILKKKLISGIKTYWKPITFCTFSIGCQVGSVFIFTKRQQQLVIATHQMENLLRRYTEAATATAGVGGAAAVNKLEPTNYPEKEEMSVDDDGKCLFWDPVFNYWFRTSQLYFTEAAYQTCVNFCMYGGASVSEFYKFMDVTPPQDENEDGYLGWGWYVDDDFKWCDYYGEASTFIGITYSEPKTTSDGLEYREVCYYHQPMFNMNGLMMDINGKDYFGY